MDSWLRSVNDGDADALGPGAVEGPAGAAWSPPAVLVALAWVGTGAAVVWCVLVAGTADRPGLLLAVVAALGLGLAALYGSRARPRLRIDGTGLTVGGLTGPRHHPWADVGDVRVLAVRRLGRESTALEIDVVTPGGPGLLVFGRLDLDADPADVAAAVCEARPA